MKIGRMVPYSLVFLVNFQSFICQERTNAITLNNQSNQCVPRLQIFPTFRTQIGVIWTQFLKLPQTGGKSQTYFTAGVLGQFPFHLFPNGTIFLKLGGWLYFIQHCSMQRKFSKTVRNGLSCDN